MASQVGRRKGDELAGRVALVTGGARNMEAAVLDAKEASTAAYQARVVAGLEEARLQAIATNEVIGHARERVSSVEHQQAHALTAAEVARNRAQLFEQHQQQEAGELEELTRAQSVMEASLVAIELRWRRLNRNWWSVSPCLPSWIGKWPPCSSSGRKQ